jgi:aquaporin Z
MKKYITEFIGTFFLILTIGLTVISGKGDFAPIAIGSVLMIMIFAGGHISGAHYNPAVTLAVWIRGRISLPEALVYMIVQIAGAFAASMCVIYLLGDKMPYVQPDGFSDMVKPLVAEILGTFALCYVVLNVATAKANNGNSFYGLAIGFTVTAMAYALGGISGGAFNPAVAVGISNMNLAAWGDLWVFMAGNFGGAALAAIVFKANNADDK